MKLFEAVHPEIFTVLASPNKELYAGALEVLYEAYQEHWRIPENTLYSMLRGRLERQISDASFESEDIDEEELRDVSGRTRFLMRKLCSRGWFEKERGKDFEEYIIVPGYSSMLLELFHLMTSNETMRGYSYVFDTYSSLKVAWDGENIYDKMISIYSAYDNTQALIKMLRTVHHNVKRYFQLQIDLQNVNEVLASHFDDFGQKVIEAYVRPLKIRDSVPKYRVPIISYLNKCLEDDAILLAISNASLLDKRKDTLDKCRADILEKVFWIKDQYGRIESVYLEEIDEQIRRYTRATTQKIENLTNRDQNTKGNLNYLLTELSQNRNTQKIVEDIQPIFNLFKQSFISEKSLWYRRQPTRRDISQPVAIEEDSLSDEAMADAVSTLSHKYSKAAVSGFMEALFADSDVRYSKDLHLTGDHEYIMSILAVLAGYEPGSFYSTEVLAGDYKREPYRIPQLRFSRRTSPSAKSN
jgi:hypothetical protein